jgi:hypothetical protein
MFIKESHFMKAMFRKILSLAPVSSVSFTAKSAVIATALAATGRAFAGGSPSGGGVPFKTAMLFTDAQAEVLKALALEKIESGLASDEEAQNLQAIVEKIELAKKSQVEIKEKLAE